MTAKRVLVALWAALGGIGNGIRQVMSGPSTPPSGQEDQPNQGLTLETMDQSNRDDSLRSAASEVGLIDEILLHVSAGTAQLNGRPHGRGINFVAGLLIHRAFNSLWRSRLDALDGYTVQSLTLCRAAFEDWASLRWIEVNPDKVGLWLWAILPDGSQPTERPPGIDRMMSDLEDAGVLNDADHFRTLYDQLSKFAHPKSQGLAWGFHVDGQSTHFHVGGFSDDRDLKTCLWFILGTAQAFLQRVGRLQEGVAGGIDEAWMIDAQSLSARASSAYEAMGRELIQYLDGDASAQRPTTAD